MQKEPDAALSSERLRLISEIGDSLTDGGEVEQVMGTAARAMLHGLADVVVLAYGGRNEGVRLEVAHRDPTQIPLLRERIGAEQDLLRRLAAGEAGRGRRFRWMPAVNSHALRFAAANSSRTLNLLQTFGVHSLLVIALRAGGRTIGVLGLGRTERAPPYSSADLAVAQVVARRTAVALDAARLMAGSSAPDQRQARLRGALRKWTRVFDLANWGAAVVDGLDRRIEVVNPAFARIHGHASPDDLTGRLFDDLLAPEHRAEADDWAGALNGNRLTYESLHLRADGARIPVLVNLTPLESEGEPGSYVVTLQELTDLKRAEDRLRRAQRMEAVGRLAGGVAHEVNNMMTIILGFSDLLGRAPELPASLQRDVDEIRKAADRAGKVTQQLLAFSRQQVLQPTDLSVNHVTEELVPVLRLLLPANVRVETELAPLDARVRADRAQLEQVMINLAFNARDAMPDGGTIRIATEVRHLDEEDGRRLIGIPFPAAPYALLHVVDTGHGMDRQTLGQVFEPFFTTKPAGAGTGLGLATVYGIVKQTGGYVWVDSTPGQGTTFTIALPSAERSGAEVARVARAAPEPRACGLILVVEDEDGVRELAGRILRSRGYDVLQARNGSEALSLSEQRSEDLDLVLTDVVLPDLPIGELEQRLRDRRADLPILYMSGYARDDVLQRKLIRNDAPFLQKPFTGEELVEGVGRVRGTEDEVVGR